jgi:hypothetical protein
LNENKKERPDKRSIVPMIDEKEEIEVPEPVKEKSTEEIPNF